MSLEGQDSTSESIYKKSKNEKAIIIKKTDIFYVRLINFNFVKIFIISFAKN